MRVRSGLVRRRSAWPIADLNVLAPQIAQIAAAGLSALRDRFDGAARFAVEVDYEYLADDSLEIAEAVAYVRYIGGDTPKAVAGLMSLAGRSYTEGPMARRSTDMATMMISDPRRLDVISTHGGTSA